MQWQAIQTFQDLGAAQQAAGFLNEQHFATGDRGAVSVDLPFAVPAMMVSAVQAGVNAAGVVQWQPVYADGSRLVIPFEKHSFPIPLIIGVLIALVIAGVIFITIWKLYGVAETLAGPWGMLLAAGAVLWLAPSLIGQSHRAVYDNPRRRHARRNPIDNTALLQVAGLGLVGAAGFEMAKRGTLPGVLQDAAHSLAPGTIPAAPPTGATKGLPAGTSPGPRPPEEKSCFNVQVGNTRLDFEVTPSNPPRQEGALVTFTGRLTRILGAGLGYVSSPEPLAGQIIEFWDAAVCQRFDQAITDAQGFFSLERPLASDELDGYRIFARFSGGGWFPKLDPYVTGVWAVVPQG